MNGENIWATNMQLSPIEPAEIACISALVYLHKINKYNDQFDGDPIFGIGLHCLQHFIARF